MIALTIPVLPSPDFAATLDFYRGIGFSQVAVYPGEYLVLEHASGIELHFFHQPALDPATNDHGAYVRFDSDYEAESLYNQWLVSQAGGELHPPVATDYQLLEFALLDPHRNLLRVGGAIDPA